MATSIPKAPGLVSPTDPESLSYRARWASHFIREEIGTIQLKTQAMPTQTADENHILPIANTRTPAGENGDVEGFNVGIIGAGAAGLFTAMLFDYLNVKYPGLNVKYEVLEAEEERPGGRLYTYKFPEKEKKYPIGDHDYYDVGAMRFPDVPTMKRTFELFKELQMGFAENTKTEKPNKGDLVPYYFSGPNQPALYNGIQVVQCDGEPSLSANTFQVPDIPITLQNTPASNLIDNRILHLKEIYKDAGAKVFWDELRTKVDPYSVRQYFTTQINDPFDYKTLEFCETLNYGNRWYDQAASEMVLESLDFDPNATWWCVEGGAAEIAYRMKNKVRDQDAFHFGKVVKEISYNKANMDHVQVDVKVDGETKARTYDAVFNSAPLGAMQHMHLEGLNLSYGMKSAIRSLGYGASCKVGIRFKTLWWIEKLGISEGGQGRTDLPIRCCVYPSYNIHDPTNKPGVLLVSYTWSQEAERIGALIDKQSPANENELKALIFHDLARLHSPTNDEDKYRELYQLIEENYLDHYAYNWYQNPRTVGAFAYFGPGQFSNWYKDLTKSDGKYVVIGEAASAHHAWVVGALESAVRGVYQFLWKHSAKSTHAAAATEDYNKDKIPMPFGPVPAEYDRSEDLQNPTDVNLKKQAMPSPRGELARTQVLFESLRLSQGGDVLNPELITKEQIAPILDLLTVQKVA